MIGPDRTKTPTARLAHRGQQEAWLLGAYDCATGQDVEALNPNDDQARYTVLSWSG